MTGPSHPYLVTEYRHQQWAPLSLNLSNRPRSGHPRYKRIILRPKRTSRKIPLRLQSQSNLSNYLMEQEDSPWKISLTPDDPTMTGGWQELVSSEVTCCRKILPSSIYDNKSALISKKKKKSRKKERKVAFNFSGTNQDALKKIGTEGNRSPSVLARKHFVSTKKDMVNKIITQQIVWISLQIMMRDTEILQDKALIQYTHLGRSEILICICGSTIKVLKFQVWHILCNQFYILVILHIYINPYPKFLSLCFDIKVWHILFQ